MNKIGIKIPGTRIDENKAGFIKQLNLLAKAGYQAIELSLDDFDCIRAGEIDQGIVEEIKEILQDFGFELSVHAPLFLDLSSSDHLEIHQRVFQSCIDIAMELGAGLLAFHPENSTKFKNQKNKKKKTGVSPKFPNEKEFYFIKKILQDYPSITIAFENSFPYSDLTAHSYSELIKPIDDYVERLGHDNAGLLIDTGHLNLSSHYHSFNPVKKMKNYRHNLVHLHISDNHGIPGLISEKDKKELLPFGKGDEHLPPGYGNFPFYPFFKSIKGYQGNYIIEMSNRYFYPMKIAESFETLKSMLIIWDLIKTV